jgi:hypothetical protein
MRRWILLSGLLIFGMSCAGHTDSQVDPATLTPQQLETVFESLAPGMTDGEVVRAVGQPDHNDEDASRTYLYYSRPVSRTLIFNQGLLESIRMNSAPVSRPAQKVVRKRARPKIKKKK